VHHGAHFREKRVFVLGAEIMTSEEARKTIERLEQAKRVMLAVKPELFSMNAWTGLNECGTTHCVGGWLRLDPWFQENTTILDIFSHDYGYVYVTEWSITHSSGLATLLAEVMNIRTSEAKALFGIPIDHPSAPETLDEVVCYLDVLRDVYTEDLV
jgi:hypothetical protein